MFTDSLYRCKGLYKNSIYLCSRTLFEGYSSKIIKLVKQDNEIAMKTMLSIGYNKTKTIWHLTAFGIKHTVVMDLKSNLKRTNIIFRAPKGAYAI